MAWAATLSLAALPARTAHADVADATGGTPGPAGFASAQAIDVAGVGGTQAPIAQGTGGSEYGIVQPQPRAPRGGARNIRHTARPARRRSRTRRSARPNVKPTARPPVAPPPPPKAAPPTTAEPPPGAPTPAQTVAEGAVFPVRGPHSFGGPENRFGAPRGTHTHEGQDILAAEGVSEVAPLAGMIATTGYQAGGAGWYVVEHTAGAFDFFFAHCQAGSVGVRAGDAVAVGAMLCSVGATGDATGPHLHFEMWLGGWHAPGGRPIDPLPYLQAWEAA